MASLRKDIPLGVAPSEAWAALRDFGAVHQRVVPGFVTDATLDGDDRIVTFANGVVVRERLVSLDDERRRLVYAVVESSLGFEHHQASVEVIDPAPGTGGCSVAWTTDLLPDEVAPSVAAFMDQGAVAMARRLAG
jgi:hypothetical protein